MLKTLRRELAEYEGTWILPDDLDALVEIIETALAKSAPKSIGTDIHWCGCYRYTSHHPCAIAEVEQLQAALLEILNEATSDRDWDIVETAALVALNDDL